MALDGEVVHGELTGVFGKYVENELKESPNKQIKISEFFKHIDKNYSTEKFDSYIVIGNTNIKSIYFDEHNRNNLDFEIDNSKDLKIIVNEKHKIAKLSMLHCKNIELIFVLENGTNGFIHQNNCSFFECEFKTIAITPLSGYQDKFVFNYKLNFENTTFKEPMVFNNKIFKNDIKFINCIFEKNAYFSNSIFEKLGFFIVIFKDNVYFNNSKFNGAFMLDGTQFDKIAHFFNVEIKNIFSFSSCLFKESNLINFTTLKIDMNVKMLEDNINKISKEEVEKNNQINIKERKRFWAENLRNSFAVIKHNFIQRNNLIEAQKYKIAEFYAEELRLKYVRETKKNTQKQSCFKKLKTTMSKCWKNIKECAFRLMFIKLKIYSLISFITPSKATIDYFQLLFYRHTSNHHSDLLKSFNTMLLPIGLFAIFNYVIMIISNYNYSDIFIFDPRDNLRLYKISVDYFINTLPLRYLIFINFIITFGFLLIFFVLCICIYFQNKIVRFIVVFLSYLCSILLLLFSPKSIISITNLFSGNQHILDPLSALSGIYTILFILLIYSLQKTSRRNSIM